jgi:hypothetical protein
VKLYRTTRRHIIGSATLQKFMEMDKVRCWDWTELAQDRWLRASLQLS